MPKEELVKIAGLSVLLVRSSRKTLAVQIRADEPFHTVLAGGRAGASGLP